VSISAVFATAVKKIADSLDMPIVSKHFGRYFSGGFSLALTCRKHRSVRFIIKTVETNAITIFPRQTVNNRRIRYGSPSHERAPVDCCRVFCTTADQFTAIAAIDGDEMSLNQPTNCVSGLFSMALHVIIYYSTGS